MSISAIDQVCPKAILVMSLTLLLSEMLRSGAANEVLTGGRILAHQTHLPPNSDFFSGFGHFFLKILKNDVFG